MSDRATNTGRFSAEPDAGKPDAGKPHAGEQREGAASPVAPPESVEDERAVLEALEVFERSPRAFADLALKDARGEATEREAAFLRHPLVARRWRRTLVDLNNDVEAQLGRRRRAMERLTQERQRGSEGGRDGGSRAASDDTYRRELADYNRWRDGALKFKATLERAMAEAREYVKGLASVRSGESRADALREQSRQSQSYRAMLSEVRDFLSADAQLHPVSSPRRDDLLERIDHTLFPGADESSTGSHEHGQGHGQGHGGSASGV